MLPVAVGVPWLEVHVSADTRATLRRSAPVIATRAGVDGSAMFSVAVIGVEVPVAEPCAALGFQPAVADHSSRWQPQGVEATAATVGAASDPAADL